MHLRSIKFWTLFLSQVLFQSPAFAQSQGPIFIENKGQWDNEILYGAQIHGGHIFLKNDGLRYELKEEPRDVMHAHDAASLKRSLRRTFNTPKSSKRTIDARFIEAQKGISVVPERAITTKYNYYISDDESTWASGCRAFESLTLENVYEGIDFKLYVQDNSIKYDWIIQAGADPRIIQTKYEGNLIAYTEGGCSFIDAGVATIMENRPMVYQVDEVGNKHQVACSYQLSGNVLSYEMPKGYDRNKKLVIDPELVFSTFSGSTSDNFGYTACFDDEGGLYSGGIVFGNGFPVTTDEEFGGGLSDIAILKFDSAGTELEYATFLGGSGGESPHSLIVNNKNQLVILGTTGSADYPTTLNAYDDSFNGGTPFTIFDTYENGTDIIVSILGETGELLASTFVGSEGNDGVLKMMSIGQYENDLIYNYGDYQRGDIAVDDQDNIFIASSTNGLDFPIVNAVQDVYSGGNSDAIAFSLTGDLSSMRWSTYLGGANDDAAYSIKLNDNGEAVVAGGTNSDDFPTTNDVLFPTHQGGVDGFISIINSTSASLAQSTFLGTPEYDQAYFVDIDQDGFIYATGQTTGLYPVAGNVYSNPNSGHFIHKISSDLSSTAFSTVFGDGVSRPNLSPTAFLANECGNIFFSGWGGITNTNAAPGTSTLGSTENLPVTSNAFRVSSDGSDFYLLVLSSDGSELLYGSYYGSVGSTGDHVDGGTSRFDKRGIIYQAACSCGGSDDNFPTTEGAYSRVNRGVNGEGVERCNNAAFKFDLATLKASFDIEDQFGQKNISVGCIPLELNFINKSIGGQDFLWEFDNGQSSTTEDNIQITYTKPGTYTMSLTVTDDNTCSGVDVFTRQLRIFDDQISVSSDVSICRGDQTQLSANGGVSYHWLPSLFISNQSSSSPIVSPTETTTYTVEIETPNGCLLEEEVTVSVEDVVFVDFEVVPSIRSCNTNTSFEFINNTEYDGEMIWDFGDGQTATADNLTYVYETAGSYTATLLVDENCVADMRVSLLSEQLFVPNVITPNNDGRNDQFVIDYSLPLELTIIDRTGSPVYESSDYQNNWDAKGVPSGVYYYNIRFSSGTSCRGWLQVIK